MNFIKFLIVDNVGMMSLLLLKVGYNFDTVQSENIHFTLIINYFNCKNRT